MNNRTLLMCTPQQRVRRSSYSIALTLSAFNETLFSFQQPLAMPLPSVLPPLRRAHLRKIPLTLARQAIPLTLTTAALSAFQAILGTPRRWNAFQLLVLGAVAGIPGITFLRPLKAPLLLSWAYGLFARLLAPAHARSLQFWKRVVPIYLGYKKTQTSLKIRGGGEARRAKVWGKKHEWGAEKVGISLLQGAVASERVKGIPHGKN